jgi:NTP pyrophosphatase (non-canonical NTP hydrolase)
LERTEDQTTLSAWGEETFGPTTAPDVLILRAQMEMAELLDAARSGNADDVALEIADVFIMLYRVGTQFGVDVDQAIARKMQINRRRRWQRKGDGTGSHIKG